MPDVPNLNQPPAACQPHRWRLRLPRMPQRLRGPLWGGTPGRRLGLAGAAVAAAAALAAPQADAALTENLTTSVTAMALGNAVTADPPGIDSIHFNPAGLARMTGDSESIHNFAASIRTSASFQAPPGFDVGGWTDDPVSGTHTGPVRQ